MMAKNETNSDHARGRLAWPLAKFGAVALALALSCTESADPDLGFHLATGRAVLANRSIPAQNVLSFAEPNHPWLDHSALSSVALELAYRAGGFVGTRLLQASITALIALFVMGAARRLGARPGIAFFFCALGAWAAAFRFVERPLIFSNLALAAALWTYAVLHERISQAQNDRLKLPCVGAGLAMALGAQLHAGAIFAVAILTAMALGLAIEPWTARYKKPFVDAYVARRAALGLFLATAAALVVAAAMLAMYHPFGVAVLSVPFRIGFDAYLLEHIVEFRAAYELPFRVLAPFWLFFVLAVAVVGANIKRAPLPLLVPVVAGFALAIRHGRFVDLAWITAAPALATLASESLSPLRRENLFASGILVAALLDRTAVAPMKIGPSAAVWPMPLFDVVQSKHLDGPSFVQDGWAGPFLARFWPKERVFFHPVFEAYSKEHIELYQSVRYGEKGWEETFDKYDIQVVLMKHTSEREREFQLGKPNLRQHLAANPGWALLAFDEFGALWVRRNGKNAGALDNLPSMVDPDRGSFVARPKLSRRGLETLLQQGPVTVRLMLLLAVARADDGDRQGVKELLERVARESPDDPRFETTRAFLMKH
ncbi:MAG TPA: hypothetical protein PK156_19455 [Polyangium sp.]|nr:hypothetical protein [Polyangium sp.]